MLESAISSLTDDSLPRDMQTSFYLIFVLAAVAATAVALPAPLIPNPNESSGDSVDPLPSHHLVHELEQFVSAANKLFNNSTFLLVEAITAWFNTLTANKYYTSTSGVEPESDAASVRMLTAHRRPRRRPHRRRHRLHRRHRLLDLITLFSLSVFSSLVACVRSIC